MSEQVETPQPELQTSLRIQFGEIQRLREEINNLNDNRMWLMALLQDTKADAINELAIRDSQIITLKEQLEAAS